MTGSLSCPEEGAVPLLGPGGSTQRGWAARPWAPLCFLSSVPQAPQVLGGTASPFLGFGLQTQRDRSHQQVLRATKAGAAATKRESCFYL